MESPNTLHAMNTAPLRIHPSGTPFVLPCDVPSDETGKETERLHIGNRWIAHSGLYLYDNSARLHDPIWGRFDSTDPLAEKFGQYGVYNHCHANPLNFIDINGGLEWPVDEIFNGGMRRHDNNYHVPRPNGRRHEGVDINIGSGSNDLGAPVYATHDGTITRMAHYSDGNAGGTRIRISTPDGSVSTFYMHLNSIEDGLSVGTKVSEGMKIGTIGGSGPYKPDVYKPHLHYEMFINGKHVNPAIDAKHLIDPQALIEGPRLKLKELIVVAPANNTKPLLPVNINVSVPTKVSIVNIYPINSTNENTTHGN